ncbi:MAG: methylated-DNA--[protein]-cysteine S-methyltransferase [Paracoccaceae bacterium]
MNSLSFDSPLGWITVTSDGETVTALDWSDERRPNLPTPLLYEARDQIKAYFADRLRRFDLPMSCPSTPFQHAVFESMMSIPFGGTKTYGEIAVYTEGSPQAVGRACGANPIPILIPCHRVVGANGLGGYSGRGGIETKVFLLRHERAGGVLL